MKRLPLTIVLVPLAAGLVATGCKSDGGAGTSPDEPAEARAPDDSSEKTSDGDERGSENDDGAATDPDDTTDDPTTDGSASSGDGTASGSDGSGSASGADDTSTGGECVEECVRDRQMQSEPIEKIRRECREECGVADGG